MANQNNDQNLESEELIAQESADVPDFGVIEAELSGGSGDSGKRLSQKEAVFQAITRIKGTDKFDGPVELSRSERQRARDLLFQMFKQGAVTYGGDLPDDKTLYGYTSGLISNWLRKDTRLSGGEKYKPKRPGTRVGTGDEQLKALKALLAITSNPEDRRKIEEAIQARQEELKPRLEINVEALPEHLRYLAPTNNSSE